MQSSVLRLIQKHIHDLSASKFKKIGCWELRMTYR